MSDTTKELEFISFHRNQFAHGSGLRESTYFRWFLGELDKKRTELRQAVAFYPLIPDGLDSAQLAGIRAQLHMLDNLVSEDAIRCPMVERMVEASRKNIPGE
jgi:hypothetical protein